MGKEREKTKFKPVKAPHMANVRNNLLRISKQNEKLREKKINKDILDIF